MSTILKKQSHQEEIANAITHGIGLVGGVIFTPFLIYRVVQSSNDKWLLFGTIMFCFGMIMTYLASTVYHSVKSERRRNIWRTIDHISIYYLIGGTYLPLILTYMTFTEAKVFLIAMWSLILLGTILKLFFAGKYEIISLALYLFLGFMIVFEIGPIWQTVPSSIMWLIAIGGAFYTIGTYFYIAARIKYSHAIWHVLVLLGTFFHSIAIWKLM